MRGPCINKHTLITIAVLLPAFVLYSCSDTDKATPLIVVKQNDPELTKYVKTDLIAKVEYGFSGCFGHGNSLLTISRTDKIVYASLENNNNLEYATVITHAQLDSFYVFVNKLKSLNLQGFCTTAESYKVFINGNIIEKTDGSCDWNGFSNLKRVLFNMRS